MKSTDFHAQKFIHLLLRFIITNIKIFREIFSYDLTQILHVVRELRKKLAHPITSSSSTHITDAIFFQPLWSITKSKSKLKNKQIAINKNQRNRKIQQN